jgi:hypothetical protein
VELYHHSPKTPSWRGAQLKEVQGQLYFTLFTLNRITELEKSIMHVGNIYIDVSVETVFASLSSLPYFTVIFRSVSTKRVDKRNKKRIENFYWGNQLENGHL